jgi:deoxyribodipyrimidine photo-lyase
VLEGKPEEIIPNLVKKYDIDCVYTNTSYGNYGKARDAKVIELCGCNFESHKDFLLAEPHEVEQRKVFTPYYKLWQKLNFDTSEIQLTRFKQLQTSEQSQASDFIPLEKHPYFTMEFGQERFENAIRSDYIDLRNDLDKDGTSRLSPYLRFGIFSVRQIYNRAKNISETYVSEMAWREFWQQILYNFPDTKTTEFQEKRRHIEWSRDPELFQKWCDGETGYPVVDAAMKQLNQTNWMHGRARMIVASFLTKDMHIDWRL